MGRSILLVEDSKVNALLYKTYLTEAGYRVHHASTIKEALPMAHEAMPEAAVIDIELPDGNGIDLLKHLRAEYPDLLLIIVTAHATVDFAVEALKQGAHDFIQKPFNAQRLLTTMRNALAVKDLRREVKLLGNAGEHYHDFVGDSAPMQALYRVIEQVAASRIPVFITGESGTGKELAARALHAASPRARKNFHAINCAAIPNDLLESEIFGHIKGAFTGATTNRPGAALAADGGTLFLDEICEMPLDLQAKLLRLIQTQTVQQVGSDKEIKVDVRFVAATNKAPWTAVENGTFREDLFYRLNVVRLEMPPLRDRPEDIEKLAGYFLSRYAQEEGRSVTGFTDSARRALLAYHWPGNVRQLENAIRYAVVMTAEGNVDVAQLPQLSGQLQPNHQLVETTVERNLSIVEPVVLKPLWQAERDVIYEALRRTNDDVSRAAALLEVAPSTIYRKLQQWKTEADVKNLSGARNHA